MLWEYIKRGSCFLPQFIINIDPLKIHFVFTFVTDLLPLQTKLTFFFHFPYPSSKFEISGTHLHIFPTKRKLLSDFIPNVDPLKIDFLFTFVANLLPLQAKLIHIFHYPCSRSTFKISSTPEIHIFFRSEIFQKLFDEYGPTQNWFRIHFCG